MKPVLHWAKKNLLIVISVVVTVLVIPTALFFSMRQNAALVEQVQSEVSRSERDLDGLDVTYRAESFDASAPAVEFQRPPNEATTASLKAYMDRLQEAGDAALEAVVAVNSQGKVPLMEGFFPQPQADPLRMRQRWGELWVPAHRRLIEEAEAGPAPDPEQVRTEVQLAFEERRDAMTAAREDNSLTREEVEQLREQMTDLRLSIYSGRASDQTVYATPSVFAGVERPDPTQPVSVERAWDMQHRYWIHEDIIRAIREANTDASSGWPLRVPEGVVKRIESIAVRPWYFESAPTAQPAPGISSPIAPDYEVSLTGRTSWPGSPNGLYDARFAEVTLLAASDRLPRLIEAISSVNLMTVTSMSVGSIDMEQHLEAGYYYGEDHVVRVTMRIETLWLRPWMAPLMPEGVRRALGVPDPAPAEDTNETGAPADLR